MKYLQQYERISKIFLKQGFLLSHIINKEQMWYSGRTDDEEGFLFQSSYWQLLLQLYITTWVCSIFFSFFLLLSQLLSYFNVMHDSACLLLNTESRIAIRHDTTISVNASAHSIKNIWYKRVYFGKQLSCKFSWSPVWIYSYFLSLFVDEA